MGWLVLDAIAWLGGIALSGLIEPPPTVLPLVLVVFAGLCLLIGMGELLPRSRAEGPSPINPLLTALCAAFVASLALMGAP